MIAPDENVVQCAAEKYLTNIISIERVPKGCSTFVYRINTISGIYYARFLPEKGSFAAEITAHKLMKAKGVSVPKVVAFEHKEKRSGLSMMLIEEIPGISMEELYPNNDAPKILFEAGKQLALIHSIPVDGFGWNDRDSHNVLKGEKSSFCEYFDDFIEDDLSTLHYYDFTAKEREQIRVYMEQARIRLNTENAVLVHGDFDVTHIFHSEGKFTGIIDFGEIRGNNRLYDLATFAYGDMSPHRTAYYQLVNGYREAAPLDDNDMYSVELMALFILLRFAGKKVETKSHDFWEQLLRKQLKRLINYNFVI